MAIDHQEVVGMTFKPTLEQQRALDLFATGESLVIEAGAGTGKTSTLTLLAASTDRRGQYIAFNRAIVNEAAEKFPGTVACSTAHSLAFRAVGHDYAHRMRRSARMRSIDIANRLGIDALKVTAFDGEEKLLSQSFLAGVALRAATRFCQSADAKPELRHVPYIEGLDPSGPDGRRRMVNRDVARHLLPAVTKVWQDWTSVEGGLPYRHDAYLKLWQLSQPRIGADYILFDEAQDANPVMVAIVAAQTHAQLVWVGDSQQQIYAFTGAVNALAQVPADHRTFLTQSFRFGPAVAEVANTVLATIPDAELRLIGTDTVASTVAPVAEPDAILTRTNAEAIRNALEALRDGKRVHLVGGTDEITKFARAARDLMQGVKVDHPELACFDNWSEVQEYVADDEQGGELRLMVKLIDEFTVEVILTQLAALDQDESKADLVVSTAHKSKGREWNAVQLGTDFEVYPEDDKADEKRLLYVAVTRARRELDITAVPFFTGASRPAAPVVATTEKLAREHVVPARVEPVKAPVSKHIGTVGGTVEFDGTVQAVRGLTTKFGFTYLTTFVDGDGNVVKAFLSEEEQEGERVHVTGRVKQHGEYRGVAETTINYARVEQARTEEVAA
jgi:hypothetical protein